MRLVEARYGVMKRHSDSLVDSINHDTIRERQKRKLIRTGSLNWIDSNRSYRAGGGGRKPSDISRL